MPEITDEEFRLFQRYQKECRYRIPFEIKKISIQQNEYSFPICPRCKDVIDREYQSFCDRCGQRLAWNWYDEGKVKVVKPKKVKD